MDLKNFDKQIKSSLENIEMPFDSASWQALESRMNAGISEEQPSAVEPVDLVVKRTLERFEVPYQAADWNVLQAKLNQNILVRRIRMSKVAEAAIFLLLLVNIEGFLGGFKEVLKPAAPAKPKVAEPMAETHRGKGSKHRTTATQAEDGTMASLAERVVALISAPFVSENDAENDLTGTSPLAVVNPSTNGNTSMLDAANFYSASGIVKFNKLEKLPQAKIQDFAWKNFFETIPGVITPTPRKSNGLYAASFASFDKNNIHQGDFATQANGFGGGVAIGYRKGKWGVETGLAYSQTQFTPQRKDEFYAGNPVDGFLASYVKDVDADVFSVPVKVTRRMARFGRTTAHAVAGLTANVATQKRYGYKTVLYPPTSPQPNPTPGIDPTNYPIPNRNQKGALEGGSFKTNAYATADVGMRVEQPLGKRYVAFVEPTYRRSLGGGFGPKRERINSFTIHAGVMASL